MVGEIDEVWELIRAAQVVVLDIDGVVCVGDHPTPGARKAVSELNRVVPRLLFVTNDSRRNIEGQFARLADVLPPGNAPTVLTAVDALIDEVVTGGHVAVNVWGPPTVSDALEAAGVRVDPDRATALVTAAAPTGWRAEDMPPPGCVPLLNRGAPWLATNPDASVPVPGGEIPDAGAIIRRLESLTGRRPRIVGKPHAPMLRLLRERIGTERSVLVIGDRIDSDVAFARAGRYAAVLVGDCLAPGDPEPNARIPTLGSLVDVCW